MSADDFGYDEETGLVCIRLNNNLKKGDKVSINIKYKISWLEKSI